MPRIIIDNLEVECRDGIPVLQAALEAGWDVPHYCYHPGLSIVASCRLCLMEMKMPHPKTRELVWSPKLVPSCQTPVRDGMEVRFDSDLIRKNQQSCMEFYLLNHPLDCPVCDQAGECYLQDYSFHFGRGESRMVDEKWKNPKKDIGPHTLLYQDRCVMCSRCVRFTDEISGTHELCVVNRGVKSEIDVFPGRPLDNPLQGNVVDICPVGSLLDKSFLFKRRVWELRGTPSVCPGCATGCSIHVDHADGRVYRLKPRYNPRVNQWWMCDEGRFGFDYVHDRKRIASPKVRRGLEETTPSWQDVPRILQFRLEEHVRECGPASVAALLSPFMACEEAFLLCGFLRQVAPQATLAVGPIPVRGEAQRFPVGAAEGAEKFVILKEKCPNRRGVETVIRAAGEPVLAYDQFLQNAQAKKFSAAWIVGGYPESWVDKELEKVRSSFKLLVVQDMFENPLTEAASIVLPACAWVEREGTFVNVDGIVQPFERAIDPPPGAQRDGQYLYEVAGRYGLFDVDAIRQEMAGVMPEMRDLYEAPAVAAHAH